MSSVAVADRVQHDKPGTPAGIWFDVDSCECSQKLIRAGSPLFVVRCRTRPHWRLCQRATQAWPAEDGHALLELCCLALALRDGVRCLSSMVLCAQTWSLLTTKVTLQAPQFGMLPSRQSRAASPRAYSSAPTPTVHGTGTPGTAVREGHQAVQQCLHLPLWVPSQVPCR